MKPRSPRHILKALLILCVVAHLLTQCAGQQESESNRKVVSRVVPSYPELARKMGVKGTVRLMATVAPSGLVKGLSPKGGHPLLVQAAESAVEKWKWEPLNHETTESVDLKFDPPE